MKRYGNLFDLAFSRENLYEAYLDASHNKHKKRSCFNFERRLAHNLDRIHAALHDGSYRPHPYTPLPYTSRRNAVYTHQPLRIWSCSTRSIV